MNRAPTKWPDERIERVCALLSGGASMAVIAKEVGDTRCAVSGLVSRLVKANDPRLPAVRNHARMTRHTMREDELAELLAEGSTIEAAAATMKVSNSLAFRYFKRIREKLGWQAI